MNKSRNCGGKCGSGIAALDLHSAGSAQKLRQRNALSTNDKTDQYSEKEEIMQTKKRKRNEDE